MKTRKLSIVIITVTLLVTLLQSATFAQATPEKIPTYQPNWESLSQWKVPQ